MKNNFDDFDIEKVRAKDKLSKILSVRVTRKDFEWIKQNRISATKLFNYVLHKVMNEKRDEENELIRTGKALGKMGDAITEGLIGRRK